MKKVFFLLQQAAIFCISIFIGGAVNMSFIRISGKIIPPPSGFNLQTTEGLVKAMHLMGPEHFLFPFLAHAFGTFVAAILVSKYCNLWSKAAAYSVAGLFFIGGLMMVLLLPSPLWFTFVDLILAYFPMAFLALKMSKPLKNKV